MMNVGVVQTITLLHYAYGGSEMEIAHLWKELGLQDVFPDPVLAR